MGTMLWCRGHEHTHSPSEEQPLTANEDTEVGDEIGEDGPPKKRSVNINVRAAMIHVIGDFVQSLGVFTAAAIIYFYPNLGVLDPICTFIFSALVLITTITIMRDTMAVLMEAAPRGVDTNKVVSDLTDIKGVQRVHNLRMWMLTLNKVAVSAHLAIDSKTDPGYVLREASTLLREEYNVYECTLQVERFSTDMEDCEHCEAPEK